MVISLIFDTETTGLPRDKNMPAILLKENWPDIVSLSWRLYEDGALVSKRSFIVKPEGWTIPMESTKIHGITHDFALANGVALKDAMNTFCDHLAKATTVIAHNLAFDKQVILNALFWRLSVTRVAWSPLADICTGILSTNELKLQFSGRNTYGNYKMPSLKELYMNTFNREDPSGAHESSRDVEVLEEIIMKRWPTLLKWK